MLHLPSHLNGLPPELCATEKVGRYVSQFLWNSAAVLFIVNDV